MIKNPHHRQHIRTDHQQHEEGGLVLYDRARNDVFHHKQTTIITAQQHLQLQQQEEQLKRVHSLFSPDERSVAIRHPSITTMMLLQCQVSLIQAISTIPSKRKPTTDFVKLTVSSGQQVLRWSMLCGLFVLDNVSRMLGVENEMVALDDEATVFVDSQVHDDQQQQQQQEQHHHHHHPAPPTHTITYRLPEECTTSASSTASSSVSDHSIEQQQQQPITSSSSSSSSSTTPVAIVPLTTSSRPVSVYSNRSTSPEITVMIDDVSQKQPKEQKKEEEETKQDPVTPTQTKAPAPCTHITIVTQPEERQSSQFTPPSPPSSSSSSLPPRRSSLTPPPIMKPSTSTPTKTLHHHDNNTATSVINHTRLPLASRSRKTSFPLDGASSSSTSKHQHSHVRSYSNNMTVPSQHAQLSKQLSLRRSNGRRDLASSLGVNHSNISLNNITMRPKSASSADDITQVHYHHHHHYHQQDQSTNISPTSSRSSASSMARKVIPWKS